MKFLSAKFLTVFTLATVLTGGGVAQVLQAGPPAGAAKTAPAVAPK